MDEQKQTEHEPFFSQDTKRMAKFCAILAVAMAVSNWFAIGCVADSQMEAAMFVVKAQIDKSCNGSPDPECMHHTVQRLRQRLFQ